MRPNLLELGLVTHHQAGAGASSPSPHVLVCGDADFSYSQALSSSGLGQRATIFTSCYESETDLLTRYPHAADAMASLLRNGVSVKCGVDARRLSEYYGPLPRFDRIVFNLPQSPPAPKARNQIQRHRALLRDFCASAANALVPTGELWITLLSGQGGTPLDPIQRSAGDTWQIMQQAAGAGLLVRDVESADLDVLEAAGYAPTGRRKEGLALGAQRKQKGLVVHVLAAESRQQASRLPRAEDVSAGAPSDDVPVEGVGPLEWTLDNSFWLDGPSADSPPDPATLLAECRDALGAHAAHVLADEPSLVDSYERPEDGRKARTYRFVYRSSTLALSRERALGFNADLCRALSERCFFEHRNPEALAKQRAAVEGSQGGGEESPKGGVVST
jgi:hypothetical protein